MLEGGAPFRSEIARRIDSVSTKDSLCTLAECLSLRVFEDLSEKELREMERQSVKQFEERHSLTRRLTQETWCHPTRELREVLELADARQRTATHMLYIDILRRLTVYLHRRFKKLWSPLFYNIAVVKGDPLGAALGVGALHRAEILPLVRQQLLAWDQRYQLMPPPAPTLVNPRESTGFSSRRILSAHVEQQLMEGAIPAPLPTPSWNNLTQKRIRRHPPTIYVAPRGTATGQEPSSARVVVENVAQAAVEETSAMQADSTQRVEETEENDAHNAPYLTVDLNMQDYWITDMLSSDIGELL